MAAERTDKGSPDGVAPASDREIVLTRLLNAPRDLVFDVWTDPAHVAQWWGPRGFTITTHGMDVRPGGEWRFIMHGPDGVDYDNRILYREVVRPERLVFLHGGGDDDESEPFHVTATFEDRGGKTWLTMRMLFPTAEERDRAVDEIGAIEGGNQTLDRLEEHLAKL